MLEGRGVDSIIKNYLKNSTEKYFLNSIRSIVKLDICLKHAMEKKSCKDLNRKGFYKIS